MASVEEVVSLDRRSAEVVTFTTTQTMREATHRAILDSVTEEQFDRLTLAYENGEKLPQMDLEILFYYGHINSAPVKVFDKSWNYVCVVDVIRMGDELVDDTSDHFRQLLSDKGLWRPNTSHGTLVVRRLQGREKAEFIFERYMPDWVYQAATAHWGLTACLH